MDLEQMQIAVDELARNDVSLSAATIWSRIDEQFYGGAQMEALTGLSQEQVISRVYRVRDRHFGGNIHGRIEMPPLSRVVDRPLNFFQFHFICGFDDNDQPIR
ncbi:unnamed protein product [Phytophthora lilii]|uniref:Unnamed protein product n=1 Tax=Phytophthora lilii TaxID=2077276 RepID=A0A9W6TJH0_9STRA|nr:unnamed protein product [Phytophthora lilii]